MILQYSSAKQSFFFFNDTATTEIYTLSLHDALPICSVQKATPRESATRSYSASSCCSAASCVMCATEKKCATDRKSTRLDSSHTVISYAVFCLKKQNYYVTNPEPPIVSFSAEPIYGG